MLWMQAKERIKNLVACAFNIWPERAIILKQADRASIPARKPFEKTNEVSSHLGHNKIPSVRNIDRQPTAAGVYLKFPVTNRDVKRFLIRSVGWGQNSGRMPVAPPVLWMNDYTVRL